MNKIKVVGVVGAGTMGNGIAHVFARSGFQVILCEVEQRFLDRGILWREPDTDPIPVPQPRDADDWRQGPLAPDVKAKQLEDAARAIERAFRRSGSTSRP